MEEPWNPTYYKDGEQLPFPPDGAFPVYDNYPNVMRVKGAFDPFKNRKLVLKWLPVGKEDNLENLKRQFMREAKNLHLARHGHVIELIQTFIQEQKDDDEQEESIIRLSIVMDRADCDLDAYLKRGKRFKKKESVQSVSEWFGCLVGAVAYIHGIGIRHRDIKPTNILVKNGIVLLADFGISKTGLGKTFPTTLQGRNASRTKEYCAPEVEETGSSRGRAADIFSLGAVFLEILITARSISPERADLENALTASDKTQSYAKTIRAIHQYIAKLESKSTLETWQREMLGLCKRMLDAERDRRPSAEEVELTFASQEHDDEMKPLWPCKCEGSVPLTEAQKLVRACMKGSLEGEEGLLSLLAGGADPKTVGAIHQASTRGHGKILQNLLEHGADANSRDYSGQTPLHCSAGFGHDHVVKTLLDAGADVSITDDEEQTPLHSAAAHGRATVVRLLLDKMAGINSLNLDGESALHFAARRGHEQVVQLLLERNANHEFRDAKGRTALHYAAERGFGKIVELLVRVMPNDQVILLDNKGMTALDLVKHIRKDSGGQAQYKQAIDLLIEYGAE